MARNMQILTTLAKSTFSKAFWCHVGDISRINASHWMLARNIQLATSLHREVDEYGRPKTINRFEEVCIDGVAIETNM